jgi:hypothetical protein
MKYKNSSSEINQYQVELIKSDNKNALTNGFFLTNLSPALNLNSKFTVTSENNVNNYIEPINTIQNANNSLPISVLSENNSYRFLFSYDNSNKDLHVKKILESRKRNNLKKLLEIEKENDYFVKKLLSVNSNLNRDKLNSAYAKACEYKNLAKKAKTNNKLTIKYIIIL